jgi:hypothetical protein|tara:strand:+ start:1939 stop:2637 length:699 start_codon:yes stop_codon:yes gene_type:complete
MPESITFTWSNVADEARPSPTTRKKLDAWKENPCATDYVYYLDFLGDIIGELQREYDLILVASREPAGSRVEWRPASVPFYEVSEYGDFRLLVNRSNILAGKVLKGAVKKSGHREYHVRVDGVGKHLLAHREVLFAFVGPPPTPDHQCAHWDGDPLNNHYSNLRWATAAENTADKIRHGRHMDGNRTFTKKQVLDMRSMRDAGKTYAQIREVYAISKGNLSSIINRETWNHI